ncbi:folylpolyglutamate synthase-like isoform X4 [Zingiber officinale]|uniref:folylpolyglutamate synthase-like isoform X4 n=1 Tax=Zingiber officinale TaxID=94328 RepID=UPI001C4C3CEE|nr:folylpolyglutamate synthase-like isoform X4 [Zingiber officinale]
MPLPSFAAATAAAAAAPCSVASPPTASSSPQIFNTYLATCLKLRLTSSSVRTLLPFSRRLKARSFLAPVFFRSPTPLPTDMGSNGVLLGKEPDLVLSSSYEAAMKALSSLIGGRKNNVKPPKGKLNAMLDYLKIIGVEKNLIQLNIIHIGGTKGKGSTCTFSEAILRECGFRTGLFTSPHLMDVRERFRINGLDISEDKFLYYFWDCWNILKENVDQNLPMPPLFQFLTVLAFKIFVSEKVDVAVIEVGLGGRLDSTNVVQEPVVCGITSIGMDHMEILGDTIGKIATSKSGIFKPNVPAFTVLQHPDAKLALEERASELMIPLTIVPPLDPKMMRGLTLGLAGDHQFINAGLAVALCINWLQRTGHGELVPQVLLFNCMEKRDPQLLLPPLINICASNGVHFSKVIFVPSMSVYHRVDSGSSIVIPDSPANLSWQFILQRTWEKLIHEKDFVNGNGSSKQQLDKSLVHEFHTREAMEKCGDVLNDLSCSAVIPSLPLAIKCLRDYVKENPTLSLQVLVTGSLHLVGDVLKLLKK